MLPKLIAFDLDGTLLPSDKCITERTRSVLAQMNELGTSITLATGKFHHLTQSYSETLDLKTPLVALDGAHVGGNGHEETKRCIPVRVARALIEEYQDRSSHVFSDSGDDEMLLRSDAQMFSHATRFWADRVRSVDDVLEHLVDAPAIISFYGEEQPMQELADEIGQRFPQLRVARYWSEIL